MAAFSNAAEAGIMQLVFMATAWANMADNAASSPQTNIAFALATADYTDTGAMNANEIAYTSYARVDVARSGSGFSHTAGTINPVATIGFPAGTGGSGTATHFAAGRTASGAGSATATGASLAASAGSAGGSGTATATGASTAPRAGSASGVGTASAVGSTAADGSAVGTATGQGFATAIGFSLQVIQGTGTAQGVGSAVGVSPGAVLPPVQEGGGGTGAGQPVPSAPSRFRDAIREANKPRKAKRKKTRETEATKPVTGLLAEVAETIAPEAVAAEIERQRLLGEFIDELAARIELARQVLQDEEDAAIALLLAA